MLHSVHVQLSGAGSERVLASARPPAGHRLPAAAGSRVRWAPVHQGQARAVGGAARRHAHRLALPEAGPGPGRRRPPLTPTAAVWNRVPGAEGVEKHSSVGRAYSETETGIS